jgi:PAS domain S-box-containing protein
MSKPTAVPAGFAADSYEKKGPERALGENEQCFATLFSIGPAAAISRLDDGQFTKVNTAFLRLFGYSQEEVLGHTAAELGLWPATEERDALVRLLKQRGHAENFEAAFRRKSGEKGILLISAQQIEMEGRPCLFGTLVNITERRQMEENLRQSQKMDCIGHLAGGVAHEFNNILAAMMMTLGLAQTGDLAAETRDLLQDIEKSCKRAAEIITQLLAFSRQSTMHVQLVDLAATISAQREFLTRFLGERVEISSDLAPGLPPVRVDKTLVEQVLLNLCLNARDAMENSGRLTLRLTQEQVSEARAREHPEARPGHFLRLSVADAGCGMDHATLQRLFEPFFTTKDVGQGLGLGLATVRGIVQQHQGWVEVQSGVGKGSTFSVYFPVAGPSSAAVAKPPIQPTGPAARRTILLVEDDARLRRVSRLVLERLGHKVLEAATGVEALACWEAYRGEIALIYTDMVMPGEVSGLQLAKRALAEKPSLKVILTSGYNTAPVGFPEDDGSIIYLPKPCPHGTLLEAVQRCLNPDHLALSRSTGTPI